MGTLLTIKSTTTTLVTPTVATPSSNRHLALSNLDRTDMLIFTPTILLYDGQAVEFSSVVATLKGALGKVLVEYYPFAGRISEGNSGIAEVCCDDSGVVFTEVLVEETLQEIGGKEACAELTGMGPAKLKTEGFNLYSLREYDAIPPLVIQITSFKCQTIALAVNWHHMVADGTSGMSFLKAWSQVARGLSISSPPDHRRHLMSARSPPQPHNGIPPGLKLQAPQSQTATQPTTTTSLRKKPRKKVEFTISNSDIQHLRHQAPEEEFTSGELISAHLWKLVTTARRAFLPKEDLTTFYSVLDGRKRMSSTIPENFFGNCIGWTTTTATVGEVVDMPLSQVAKLIRDSINAASEEVFLSVLDWLEVTGVEKVAHDRGALGTHDLHITFWRFFPIYEVEFGFGKPWFGGRNN